MKKIVSRIFAALMILSIFPQGAQAARTLVPVGKVVGLELHNDTVTVAAFDEASRAQADGLKQGDRLLSIDGQSITCPEDVRRALERSDGTVEITVSRGGTLTTLRVHPMASESGPKLGVYLRQGVTGIGTVTWYDPEDQSFGTLGHGVNDPDGRLLTLRAGNVYAATVAGVRKGRCGDPGQLMGSLSSPAPIGILYKNCTQGVFGKLEIPIHSQPLPVAESEQIRTGSATILSTVAGKEPQEYSVEILKIYPNQRSAGRNMLIKVTDEALLARTGGIVQGMSGSPIIQDGRLIGAVTHVLVNDPTTGYGIFIENMLEAAA